VSTGGLIERAPPRAAGVRRILARLSAWVVLPLRPARVRRPATPRQYVSLVPGAIVSLLAIALIGAAMGFLDGWAIEQHRQLPHWLIVGFDWITQFGKSGWVLWPAGILFIAAAVLARPAFGRLGNLVLLSLAVRLQFVFFAVGIPGLIVTIAKRLIGRVRPSEWGPFHYVPFSWHADYASLPSGHSTTAFAAALAIGALCPKARVPLWTCAVLIAASRVVLNAHYPSDVIAGACVGLLGAWLVRNWFAARRLGFVWKNDGRVEALPGPSLRRVKALAARLFAP
jgi:membrane-associated phospholipid phosphatase